MSLLIFLIIEFFFYIIYFSLYLTAEQRLVDDTMRISYNHKIEVSDILIYFIRDWQICISDSYSIDVENKLQNEED